MQNITATIDLYRRKLSRISTRKFDRNRREIGVGNHRPDEKQEKRKEMLKDGSKQTVLPRIWRITLKSNKEVIRLHFIFDLS
uniref:Uncharacterized protein n=1 Tax=Steinernema glaseri TaxID=37863 RepID=A0A1I7ZMN6_9BILA